MRAPLVLIASLVVAAPGCPREAPKAPEPAAEGCLVARGSTDQRTWIDGDHRATVEVAGDSCARVFTLATTAPLRDDRPANPRVVRERPDQPSLSTGNDLFDALYTLAITEARENSVAEITDGAFSEGRAIDCDCFETGRLWTYVWTRDTAYAADLGLAAIDPMRARRSLEFKLSERRGGGDRQIVQDTGSGGSYPISTDRVAWALGARAALGYLDGAARDEFARTTFEALANTIEHDRAVVFDPRDGLYRGETSFLDWREQSYAPWTATDTVHIGMSKSLSTNVDHLVAIELAARLGDERGDERAARYQRWGAELRRAIAERFYLAGDQMLASFTSTGPRGNVPAPVRRFDLLGLSLAVLEGVGTPEQRRAAIAAYPWLPVGPPVLWPQQPGVPTYHNRGIWPFVTAYAIRAARAVGNDAAVTRGILSMVRGAALNLSNMENFDALTGSPMAPVVNSQRQLWSVAGYLSMVHDVLFGLEVSGAGIRFRPYLPRALRDRLFPGIETLVLRGFRYRGRRIDVIVRLPAGAGGAAYQAGEVRLDGKPIDDGFIETSALAARSRIEIDLVAAPSAPASARVVEAIGDHQAVFGPPAPSVELAGASDGEVSIAIAIDPAARKAVSFDVYRDGVRWKSDVAGTTEKVSDRAEPGRCYSVEAVYRSSGNASQRSAPACVGGGVQVIESAALSSPDGWLRRGAKLSASFAAERGGEHWLRLRAANGAGPINTGVTCGVVAVTVTPESGGAPVGRGYLLVPHGGNDAWDRFLPSSLVRAELKKGARYRISLDTADRRAINMSAFAHFERYTGGAGGAAGPMNRIRVEAIEILR